MSKFETLAIPTGAKQVKLEELETSGKINHGVVFRKGDTIEFPDNEEDSFSYCQTLKANKDDKGYQVFFTRVLYNGKTMFIPLGSFRRKGIDWQDTMKPFELNTKLISFGHDRERLEFLFGKKLLVDSVEEFPTQVFSHRQPAYTTNADGHSVPVTRLAKFPIFKEI